MFKKSFFNPFSAMLLALVVVAFFIDVVLQAKDDADIELDGIRGNAIWAVN